MGSETEATAAAAAAAAAGLTEKTATNTPSSASAALAPVVPEAVSPTAAGPAGLASGATTTADAPLTAAEVKVPEVREGAAPVRFIGEEIEGCGGWRYACIAAAPNGRLYAPPFNCARVLEMDPATASTRTIGDDLPGGDRQYLVVVAARNGKLYAPPCSARRVVEIDPTSGSVSLIGEELPGGDMKYRAMVEGSNGRLYAPPYSAGRVLEVDPETSTVRLIGPELPGDAEKYLALAAGCNGRLYAAPCCCDQALEIDPATSSVRLFGDPLPWRGWKRYVAIAEDTKSGRLYCPPCWGADYVLEIDPEAGSARQIGEEVTDIGEKYWAIAASNNGRLYAPPCDAACTLEIDPATSSTRMLRLEGAPPEVVEKGATESKKKRNKGQYWAVASGSTGRLYAPPYNAGRVLEIDSEAGIVREIGEELPCAVGRRYQTIIEGPAGRLYAPPGCAPWLLEIDPAARTSQRVGTEVEGDGWKKYVAAAVLPRPDDGGPCRVYAPPCLAYGQVLEIGEPMCALPPPKAALSADATAPVVLESSAGEPAPKRARQSPTPQREKNKDADAMQVAT